MKIRAQVYPISAVAFGFGIGFPTRYNGCIFWISIDFLKWHFTFDIYRG